MGSAKPLPAPLFYRDSATRAGGAGRWVFSTRECYNLILYFLILFFKRKNNEHSSQKWIAEQCPDKICAMKNIKVERDRFVGEGCASRNAGSEQKPTIFVFTVEIGKRNQMVIAASYSH